MDKKKILENIKQLGQFVLSATTLGTLVGTIVVWLTAERIGGVLLYAPSLFIGLFFGGYPSITYIYFNTLMWILTSFFYYGLLATISGVTMKLLRKKEFYLLSTMMFIILIVFTSILLLTWRSAT